jgi:two-component system, cell cycle response regulator
MQTLNLQAHHIDEFPSFKNFQLPEQDSETIGLVLLEQLQTTLNIESLLNIFAMEAAKYIEFSGVYFKAPNISTCIRGSRQSKVERQFNLKIGEEFIGVLSYALTSPISLTNFKILAQLHQFLLYPLRNAIQYFSATQLARQDALTGLGNRRYFDEQMKRAMHHANRQQTLVGLILGDLNKFKAMNDTYGHQLGDQILVHVAQALSSAIRDSDCVFRFGGDEFALLVEDASQNSLELIEQRIEKTMQADALLIKHQVSCSLGSTFMNRADTEHSFFERADQALYRNKMALKRNLSIV